MSVSAKQPRKYRWRDHINSLKTAYTQQVKAQQHLKYIWRDILYKCPNAYTRTKWLNGYRIYPDSKVHGTHMGPNWVLSAPDGPHVGPMNRAIRDIVLWNRVYSHLYDQGCSGVNFGNHSLRIVSQITWFIHHFHIEWQFNPFYNQK